MLRMMAGFPRRQAATNTETDAAQAMCILNNEGHPTEITNEDTASGSDVSSIVNDIDEQLPDASENEADEREPWVDFIRRTTRNIELKSK